MSHSHDDAIRLTPGEWAQAINWDRDMKAGEAAKVALSAMLASIKNRSGNGGPYTFHVETGELVPKVEHSHEVNGTSGPDQAAHSH